MDQITDIPELSGSSELSSDPDKLVGQNLLGRYRMDQLVGRGGMSFVYRAEDVRLRRPVAVKVYAGLRVTDRAHRISYKHFIQEAFALSQLCHPNTLRIYDFAYLDGTDAQIPFQVSEYMDGGTLTDFIRTRGPASPRDAYRILSVIGGALTEAHSCDIVHRDVKPSNVLFGKAGRQRIIKLADFSIASAYATAFGAVPQPIAENTIATGISFYSLRWSAPEQIRGEHVGTTADIYGLGLVTAFMVSGKKITALNQMVDAFLPLEQLEQRMQDVLRAADLPPKVLDVCIQACRARPDERYASVDELLEALRGATRRTRSRPAPADSLPPVPSGFETPTSRPKVAPISLPPVPRDDDASVLLKELGSCDVVAAGRRIRLVEVSESADLEAPESSSAKGARIRATILPASQAVSAVHLRGLNCFLRKPGGKMTSGLTFSSDGEMELVSPARKVLAGVRVSLGRSDDDVRTFRLPGFRLAIPASAASDAVCLEMMPDGEVFLVHRR